MILGYNRFKVKASYIIMAGLLVMTLASYFYSAWAASKRHEAALPVDASPSLIKGVLNYNVLVGRFPKDLREVEERIWKHKKVPDFGQTGRTLQAYNYHYIYYRKDDFTCTLWALPAGPRRSEASSYFFYITPQSIRKWKGPDLSEDDIKKLNPTPDAALLGVMGLTEQPRTDIPQGKQQPLPNAQRASGGR